MGWERDDIQSKSSIKKDLIKVKKRKRITSYESESSRPRSDLNDSSTKTSRSNYLRNNLIEVANKLRYDSNASQTSTNLMANNTSHT